MSVYELSATEIYDSYAQQIEPSQLVRNSRQDIAARLQVEEGLKQEEAYYAADQMLAFAWQQIEAEKRQARAGEGGSGES